MLIGKIGCHIKALRNSGSAYPQWTMHGLSLYRARKISRIGISQDVPETAKRVHKEVASDHSGSQRRRWCFVPGDA
jgi:hypothetical protein